jgi:1-acyl-sn-glycerol-3-phosphate acyltransferase
MVFIRSLIFFSLLLFTTSLAALLMLFAFPAPFFVRNKISVIWSNFNLWMLKHICGLDYRVSGAENIPDEPCIFLVKHQSAWETIALFSIIPHQVVWVLKRELMWLPIFGWALALNRPIAIDRSAGRAAVKEMIEKGKARLDKGHSVIIFPEGTRVAPGVKKRYGIGGSLLAEKSNHLVVPICHNAGIFWRRRDICKYPGTVDVVIGKPYRTDDSTAQEINHHVEAWIESTLESLPQQY